MPKQDPNADVLQATASPEENQAAILAYLASIENALKNFTSGDAKSQSAARDMRNTSGSRGNFQQQYDEFHRKQSQANSDPKSRAADTSRGRTPKSFSEGIQSALLDSLGASGFKKDMTKIFGDLANAVGTDISGIPGQLGKQLTKQGLDAFKNTDLGKKFFEGADKARSKVTSFAQNRVAPELQNAMSGKQSLGTTFTKFTQLGKEGLSGAGSGISKLGQQLAGSGSKLGQLAGSGLGKVGNFVNKAGGEVGGLGSAFTDAGGGLKGMSAVAKQAASGLAKLGPYALAAGVAVLAVTKALKSFGPAIEGFQKLFKSLGSAWNRSMESSKKNRELEKQRMEADVKAIIEAPFNIMKEAAQAAYTVWDSNLRIISATQGYVKSDVQSLMAAYADRIRSENLSSIINAADLTSNLAKVLEAGLSGPVAEEFAYLATKLNAAVPTQDFFNYASEYAALIANAQQMGHTQAEAVARANAAIETYASNILYASRELTGGVTTGLQNAQSLFHEAVAITQASRTGDVSQISGVLASISAVVGGIAPDLASAITGLVTSAATGGNSDQIVALRSLANVNASNTEFLRQLANDPQSLFVELFNNLGRMQKMSEGAYMEVAEGLSGIFGVSLEALARIDFNYLAQAISGMNVGSASLDENMKLLMSGQTTLTAEQLKNQQINKYLIDEGLSYVLDNAAARSIQEHMWDEQIARELMEATYSIELKGAALDFLEGIKQTVTNIINILNPFAWIGKVFSVIGTIEEASAHDRDIRQLLELGRVGQGALTSGEQQSLYQLTTRNRDLQLMPYLVELLGGRSEYGSARAITQAGDWLVQNSGAHMLTGGYSTLIAMNANLISSLMNQLSARDPGAGIASQYRWGGIRKSTASTVSSLYTGGQPLNAAAITSNNGQSDVVARLQQMLEESYIEGFVKDGKGFNEWAATAARFGIRDLNAAMDEAGYARKDIEAYFEQKQTEQGKDEARQEKIDQQDHRDKSRMFYIDQLARMDTSIETLNVTNALLTSILEGQTDFYQGRFASWNVTWNSFLDRWTRYFIENQYYNSRTGLDYAAIKAQEHQESKGAIYALAEAFNNGVSDLSDPTVQTNALLSKILLVVSSIMQQNAAKGGSALTDTLSALAMGLTTPAP